MASEVVFVSVPVEIIMTRTTPLVNRDFVGHISSVRLVPMDFSVAPNRLHGSFEKIRHEMAFSFWEEVP
jgi:hypothetical protein